MMHQAYHVGGHGDQDNSWEPYWSPSGVPSFHDQWGSHAMTEAEIEELIAAFVGAARRDRESGFDGTDLFAGYNCLIDQFWSPLTNKRDDRWGGSSRTACASRSRSAGVSARPAATASSSA
jgi:2,4-dienoyl-CoA reductase-like NADH-dependent reductase (Old Yellow Enzyme family)